MMESATSRNGAPIRLTHERWAHITEEHTELAGLRLEVLEAVAQPARLSRAGTGRFWPCVRCSRAHGW